MKIKTDLATLLTEAYGKQTVVAKQLGCNRSTLAKGIPTNSMIVLDDGRVFRDTGAIFKELSDVE